MRHLAALAAVPFFVSVPLLSCRGTRRDGPIEFGFGEPPPPGTTEQLDRESREVVEKALEEAEIETANPKNGAAAAPESEEAPRSGDDAASGEDGAEEDGAGDDGTGPEDARRREAGGGEPGEPQD